jgi:putative ABC transport system substrate-binding protein
MRRRATLAAAITAIGAPLVGLAQTATRVRHIGVLSLNKAASDVATMEQGLITNALRRAGYDAGRNLAIEWRYGEGEVTRLGGLADELVKLNVELILAVTNEPIEAARRATRSIPIVMIGAALPVELGFIDSFARPGANVTGTAWAALEMSGKVLQVLKEAAPRAVRVAILASPTTPGTQRYRAENERAAKALGLKIRAFDMTPGEDAATTLKRVAASRPDALYIAGEGIVATRLSEIAAFAVRRKLLAIGVTPQFIPAGGALYYGPNLTDIVERTVSYIDRILKGARPADLPVEQPTKFDLIINLKTVRALGMTIPQSLLLRADEVIQ